MLVRIIARQAAREWFEREIVVSREAPPEVTSLFPWDQRIDDLDSAIVLTSGLGVECASGLPAQVHGQLLEHLRAHHDRA